MIVASLLVMNLTSSLIGGIQVNAQSTAVLETKLMLDWVQNTLGFEDVIENIEYTTDSWNEFLERLAVVQKITLDEETTQEEIDDAFDELERAFQNLEKYEVEEIELENSKENEETKDLEAEYLVEVLIENKEIEVLEENIDDDQPLTEEKIEDEKLKESLSIEVREFDVQEAIDRAHVFLGDEGIVNDWMSFALTRIGMPLTREQRVAYYERTKENVVNTFSGFGTADRMQATDIARAIIGLVSVGEDVTNIDGINLIERLAYVIVKKGIFF